MSADPIVVWGIPLFAAAILLLIVACVLAPVRYRDWKTNRPTPIPPEPEPVLSAHGRRVQRSAAHQVVLTERHDLRTRIGRDTTAIIGVLGEVDS